MPRLQQDVGKSQQGSPFNKHDASRDRLGQAREAKAREGWGAGSKERGFGHSIV